MARATLLASVVRRTVQPIDATSTSTATVIPRNRRRLLVQNGRRPLTPWPTIGRSHRHERSLRSQALSFALRARGFLAVSASEAVTGRGVRTLPSGLPRH